MTEETKVEEEGSESKKVEIPLSSRVDLNNVEGHVAFEYEYLLNLVTEQIK